jgi:hypothetical protein
MPTERQVDRGAGGCTGGGAADELAVLAEVVAVLGAVLAGSGLTGGMLGAALVGGDARVAGGEVVPFPGPDEVQPARPATATSAATAAAPAATGERRVTSRSAGPSSRAGW